MLKAFEHPNRLELSRLILLAICVLYVSFSHAKSSDFLSIEDSVDEIQKKYTVAAVSVLVVTHDKVLLNLHSGVRDWETNQRFNSKDMYRIGSISKSFAGVLALRLQQQGLINLNDSITDYGLTPYLNNSFPDRIITLAQLLEHTAGLGDLAKAEWDYNDAKPINLMQAFDMKLGDHKTKWPPGMHRSYSNVGAGLFGLALEIKLGESYESLMQTHVFNPLKMSSSGLLLTAGVKSRLITGYDRDGQKPIQYWHNIYRPFAAINTHNQDMVHWLQMLLDQDNGFLSKSNRQRLLQPSSTLAAKNDLNFGYGLGLYQWQTDGHSFYGHGGDADGYLTRFGFNLESGLAYFVMINAFNKQPLNEIIDLVENQIIADLPKPNYPKRLKLSDEQIRIFTGSYQQVTQRFGQHNKSAPVLEIINTKGQLSYRYRKGRQVNVYRVKADHFRTASQSVATMAWTPHMGSLYFQGELGNFVKVSTENQP